MGKHPSEACDCYVYEHWRPDKNECFYVGKGSGRRAKVTRRQRNSHHTAIINKLERLGLSVEVRLVKDRLSERAAFAVEIERIAFWRARGANLANGTNGGEGQRGRSPSPEQRAAISAANKGKKRSLETRRRISEANKRRPRLPKPPKAPRLPKIKIIYADRIGKRSVWPEESRRQASKRAKLRGPPKLTSDIIERIAAKHRGMKRSPETCAKIAAKAKGRVPHNKGVPSQATGVPLSAEVRQKMSSAANARWGVIKAKVAAGEIPPIHGNGFPKLSDGV